MEGQSLSAEEQEALFQVIIRKIPSVKDSDRQKELVLQALALMLRRPDDRDLKAELNACVEDLFAGAHFIPPSTVRQAADRRRAVDCIEILRAAKEHRLPRDIIYPEDTRGRHLAPEVHHHPHPHPHPHHHPASHAAEHKGKTRLTVFIVGLLVAVAVIGAAVLRGLLSEHHSVFDDAKEFTAAMASTAATGADSQTTFGVTVKFKRTDGHVSIIADGVPPGVCAAAGWDLVHKGTLTVNGVTPHRVSSALLTDLCHESEAPVALIWEPKEQTPPSAPSAK